MSVTKRIVVGVGVTALIIAIVGFGGQIAQAVTTGIPLIFAAQASAADQDFNTVKAIQQVSTATDELYVPTLESLRDGSFTYVLPTTNGRELSYAVTHDRTHYIAAERLPNGKVRIVSDNSDAITCDSYSATCLGRITEEPELIASIPNWEIF